MPDTVTSSLINPNQLRAYGITVQDNPFAGHKFGIRIPKSIKEALRVDAENGNTLWWEAIVLEMSNVRVAFEEYDGEFLPEWITLTWWGGLLHQ
jgi:hypothetical protein